VQVSPIVKNKKRINGTKNISDKKNCKKKNKTAMAVVLIWDA